MNVFAYLPNLHGGKTVERLAAHGLDGLHDATIVQRRDRSIFQKHHASLNAAEVLKGPDGDSGIVFSWPSGPAIAEGYHPDLQEWHRCRNSEAWIGWRTDDPPTPDTLSRKEQRLGERLLLGDGNEWLVPAVAQLPRQVVVDESGNLMPGKVVSRYLAYSDAAVAMLSNFLNAGDEGVNYEAAHAFCVQALAVNYRITADVALVLSLFDTESLWRVVDAATGWTKQAVAIAAAAEQLEAAQA